VHKTDKTFQISIILTKNDIIYIKNLENVNMHCWWKYENEFFQVFLLQISHNNKSVLKSLIHEEILGIKTTIKEKIFKHLEFFFTLYCTVHMLGTLNDALMIRPPLSTSMRQFNPHGSSYQHFFPCNNLLLRHSGPKWTYYLSTPKCGQFVTCQCFDHCANTSFSKFQLLRVICHVP
jgi:hypothetical protein